MEADGRLVERHYLVRVIKGVDEGKCSVLGSSLVVGAQDDCGLVLEDPTVSRHHVELRASADGVLLRDLGSSNGTFVGEARLKDAFLEGDATFRIGRTLLSVGFAESDVTVNPGAAFPDLVGQSPAMRELFGMLGRLAAAESPVLILGETGTGKEVVAKAVHRESSRSRNPFVVFDCSAVSSTLLESELFGHLRGSFTGAVTDRSGAFLDAQGGTLFLDEVGELPLELQPRLLRALESGAVKRIGETKHRIVDVRIIAATHRNLEEDVARGRFRADLYYRLAVLHVTLPPLRERPEDIPSLVRHFVQVLGREDFELSAEMMRRMETYAWPGNIRELRNVVSRAVMGVLDTHGSEGGPSGVRSKTHRPRGEPLNELPFKEAKDRLVEGFTRDYLQAALDRCHGNISETARSSGIARGYVYRLVERYGLKASPES
jgi:two-component system, NtrC family, response regulator GlrR